MMGIRDRQEMLGHRDLLDQKDRLDHQERG